MAVNTFKSHVRRVIGESFGKNEKERRLKRTDPCDPNREKYYGNTYTDRQLRILSGDLPWEVVPMHEITLLMNKAKAMGDTQHFRRNNGVCVLL